METILPDIATILFFATFAIYALLVVFMLVWQYHDAEQRGIMGWLVVIPGFMTGTLPGLVQWLMLRPAPKPAPVWVRVRD